MFKSRHRSSRSDTISWRKASMKLFKWAKKMPTSKQQYNLVTNDEFDSRIPLHSDEAFQYGISFEVKYVGSMDVPRPTSRVEIVAAMRRVRYEFKARGVNKRKVTINISVDGVKVYPRTKKEKTKKKKGPKLLGKEWDEDPYSFDILHHPIYRIFYVSHDSSDLKIFSYIARDATTNSFRCNVFKSNKKSQAMKIVRTVGQAFEVCNKMQNTCADGAEASTSSAPLEDPPNSDRGGDHLYKEATPDRDSFEMRVMASVEPVPFGDKFNVTLPPPPRKETRRGTQSLSTTPSIELLELPECVTKVDVITPAAEETPHTAEQHQLKLLREKLEQQAQQTRAAVAQTLLLRDQLVAEQSARCEAQARTHQLLIHNKELLEHISALVTHLQEREHGCKKTISAQQLTLLPQDPGNVDPGDVDKVENNNPRSSPALTPSPSSNAVNGAHAVSFKVVSNNELQEYLINKFDAVTVYESKDQNGDYNKQYFQNSRSFPHIPPLASHYSSMDLASLLNHNAYGNTMDIIIDPPEMAKSQNSISDSSKSSTPDVMSSDEDLQFIMPLSHKTILKTTCPDGRTKLIVPVSPSGSSSDVAELKDEAVGRSGDFLCVPAAGTSQGGPITRASSEKVQSNSEAMTALRSQWTRHTTK